MIAGDEIQRLRVRHAEEIKAAEMKFKAATAVFNYFDIQPYVAVAHDSYVTVMLRAAKGADVIELATALLVKSEPVLIPCERVKKTYIYIRPPELTKVTDGEVIQTNIGCSVHVSERTGAELHWYVRLDGLILNMKLELDTGGKLSARELDVERDGWGRPTRTKRYAVNQNMHKLGQVVIFNTYGVYANHVALVDRNEMLQRIAAIRSM